MEHDYPRGEHDQTSRVKPVQTKEIIAVGSTVAAVEFGVLTVAAADTAALVFASTVAAVSAVIAICYFLLDWRFRRLRRLTSTPMATPVRQRPVRPDTGCELKVRFRRPPAARDDPAVGFRTVTAHSNVVGRSPVHITYFRCFANPARTRTFMDGAWNEFGYVHLLRDPDSATLGEQWRSRTPGTMAELVVSTEAQLRDRLERAPGEPERWSVQPYGEYPVRQFFCGDGFWQQAADRLTALADLVVIDLSGHGPESLGLRFELERAFATKRRDQILVLADELSDHDYLAAQIRQVGTGTTGRVRAYILDKVVIEWDTSYDAASGGVDVVRRTELHADREESRRLLQLILAPSARQPRAATVSDGLGEEVTE